MVDYNLALNYALETYVRRDVVFIISKIFPSKKGKDSDIEFTIKHEDIEEWIQEQYEKEQEDK